MSREKMTPGPWFADEHRVNDWRIRKDDGSDGFWEIAEMSTLNPEANARAIACLPELIDAARNVLELDHSKFPNYVRGTFAELRRILARIDGGD